MDNIQKIIEYGESKLNHHKKNPIRLKCIKLQSINFIKMNKLIIITKNFLESKRNQKAIGVTNFFFFIFL